MHVPISLRPMNRILLAFLALLGIVAQAAPVEARVVAPGTEIGIAAPARRQAAHVLVVRAVALAPSGVRAQQLAPARRAVLPGLAPRVLVPAVRIGSDRSRE